MTSPRTWFITGAAAGFGREWTEAALDRGDNVIATARGDLARFDDLRERHGERVLPLTLDVTDRARAFAAVAEGAERFGALDIVVNNAGYGHSGAVEEISEAEIRASLETNLLGTLWVTQAALPILRAQGHGHIIQNTSEGGIITYPTYGAYHAAKWATEGLTQALAQEVTRFGIHLTIIEPGGFRTGWMDANSRSAEIPAYDEVRADLREIFTTVTIGDPRATRAAILEIVDAPEPPLRIFFGPDPLGRATRDYESRLEIWNAWQPLSVAAAGQPHAT